MALKFSVDEDTNSLKWTYKEAAAGVTEQQAMIVAVANVASALENIAFQLHQALEPLQEIANKTDK